MSDWEVNAATQRKLQAFSSSRSDISELTLAMCTCVLEGPQRLWPPA